MFSSAVRTGRRLKAWKTKPILSRRRSVIRASLRPASSTSSMTTEPDVGASSPARMCISVDLPEPEGPMIAANSPGRKETETPARASTAAAPSPKRRVRSVARTISFIVEDLSLVGRGQGNRG
jgi:hypothetical protein